MIHMFIPRTLLWCHLRSIVWEDKEARHPGEEDMERWITPEWAVEVDKLDANIKRRADRGDTVNDRKRTRRNSGDQSTAVSQRPKHKSASINRLID